MGPPCQALAFLLVVTNCMTNADETTSTKPPRSFQPDFLAAADDFITSRQNSAYFPLQSALVLRNESYPTKATMVSIYESTQTFIGGYRNYDVLEDKLSSDMMDDKDYLAKKFLPLATGDEAASVAMDKIVAAVNKFPTNLAALHRYAELLRLVDTVVADREFLMEGVRVPDHVEYELEFIAGYKWNVGSSEEEYSSAVLSKLPGDAVYDISADIFRNQELKTKLAQDNFQPKSWNLPAWFSVLSKYMDGLEVKSNYNKFSKFILAAPVAKMMDILMSLDASTRMQILEKNNLDPIRVQAVWSSLDKDSIAAEEISEQDVAELFFAVGNKLDMAQIDMFYTETFAHLYSKRHEVEELWIHNDNVDVPWPVLKYISKLHWPSLTTDQWGQKELLDVGAFGVALSRDELKKIPAAAFARSTTLANFFSNRFSLGQLFVIYDKINEGVTMEMDLPEPLYACLHSSLLSGEELTNKIKIAQQPKLFIQASKMYTPAQTAAYMEHLKPTMWTTENLALILKHNPALLASLGNQEFVDHLPDLLTAVWSLGRDQFPRVLKDLRALPKRLLHAWIKAKAMDSQGNLDIDKLLDRSETVDYFERLQKSDNAVSIALPGLSCDLIDQIPDEEVVEVLSMFRFAEPGEVAPSEARMCFVNGVRRYLNTKALVFGMNLTSEVARLSLLTSGDIRAIGAEFLLSWGAPVLSQIPHPQVLYEILLKIAGEYPHLYLHNGVSLSDVQQLAEQLITILKNMNKGRVDAGILKKMRDLLPYLKESSSIMSAKAEDLQNFFRTAYPDDLTKAICIPKSNRKTFSKLITKAFGAPGSWDADVLVTIGDLLISLDEADLYKVKPTVLRAALPSLVKSSVYSRVLLPGMRGRVEPSLYYAACEAWLKEDDSTQDGFSGWEILSRWHMSGAAMVANLIPSSAAPRIALKKREASHAELDVGELFETVMRIVTENYRYMEPSLQVEILAVVRKSKQELVDRLSEELGLSAEDVDNLPDYLATISAEHGYLHEKVLDIARKIKMENIRDLLELMDLTIEDVYLPESKASFSNVRGTLSTELMNEAYLPNRILAKLETTSLRKRRDIDVNYMNLHDKVMDLLMKKFSNLTSAEQDMSRDIIKESQELIGNGTLKLLGFDPSEMALSQADVLIKIESANDSMSPEQKTAIVALAEETQIRLIQKLASVMKLTPEDLGITQETWDSIMAIETFKDLENSTTISLDVTTMAPEATTMLTADSDSAAIVTPAVTEDTPVKIETIINAEEQLIHNIYEQIPKLEVLTLTCDIIRTAGASASMINSNDVGKMDASEVKDCLEVLGGLMYTQEKLTDLWPALKPKLIADSSSSSAAFSQGDMVLLYNLLPAIARSDLDLLDITAVNIDAVSVLGKVADLKTSELTPLAAKYIESKDSGLTVHELKSLGKLLCGFGETTWSTVSREAFTAALPQILDVDCVVTSDEVKSELSGKMSTSLDKYAINDRSWLAPITFTSSTNDADFREMSGSGVRNLGDLNSYSSSQLLKLNPIAASLLSKNSLQQLSDKNKLIALARASGESPMQRNLLTDKLAAVLDAYPVPVVVDDGRAGKGADNAGTRLSAVGTSSLVVAGLALALSFIL